MSKGQFSFVDEKLADQYACSICLSILPLDCLSGPCGHAFCPNCIMNWIDAVNNHNNKINKNCPYCRAPMSKNCLNPIPKFVIETIKSLEIRCNRCSTTLKRGDLDHHKTLKCPCSCRFCHFTCRGYEELKQHLKSDCKYVQHKCRGIKHGCTFEGRKVQLEQHQNSCTASQIEKAQWEVKLAEQKVILLKRKWTEELETGLLAADSNNNNHNNYNDVPPLSAVLFSLDQKNIQWKNIQWTGSGIYLGKSDTIDSHYVQLSDHSVLLVKHIKLKQ